MKKEIQKFEIKLKIRERGGKIVELRKKCKFEITWEGNRGVLNPEEKGKFARWSKGEIVWFEKNGKRYGIDIRIDEIKKGWFRDTVRGLNGPFPAPNSDFVINEWGKPNQMVRPSLKWKGFVIWGISIILLIANVRFLWITLRGNLGSYSHYPY